MVVYFKCNNKPKKESKSKCKAKKDVIIKKGNKEEEDEEMEIKGEWIYFRIIRRNEHTCEMLKEGELGANQKEMEEIWRALKKKGNSIPGALKELK